MQQLLGIGAEVRKEKQFQFITSSLHTKMFFQYRSEFDNKTQTRASRSNSSKSNKTATKSFSLFQILKLSANDLSQMVFKFDDKNISLLDDKNDTTEI